MGAFKVIILKDEIFHPQTFLYKEGQDKMSNLGKYFGELKSQDPQIFKISHQAGIFHDNPSKLKNPAESRFCYGILVNSGEEHKINEFLQKFPDFQSKRISLNVKSANFPFKNNMSFLFAVIKIYGKFHKYFQQNNIQDYGSSFEVYDMLNKQIKIMFPLRQEDIQATKISSYPRPQYKD